MAAFALVHSPLVGPSMWKLVAARLKQQGHQVVVPPLIDSEIDERPFWKQHADSAARMINHEFVDESCVLVGHSGAGPLLPIIHARLQFPAASHIFVDASIPQDQLTRLDMMKTESRAWAEQLEEHLLKGGCFPEWSDTELQAHIPNEAHRQQTISEMNPRSLAFFTEPIPLPKEWFAVPAGYIQFTDAYAVPASQAEDQGWPITRLPAGHFHMLVDPVAVSDALINMLGQLVH